MPEDPARALGFYLQRLDVGMPGGDFNRAYDYAKEPAQGGEQDFLHLRLGEILFYLVIRVCVVAFAQRFRGERDIPGVQLFQAQMRPCERRQLVKVALGKRPGALNQLRKKRERKNTQRN